MRFNKHFRTSTSTLAGILLVCTLGMAGCAAPSGPSVSSQQAQREQHLQFGVIEGLRDITIVDEQTSGIGKLGGGAIGGILGAEASNGRVSSGIAGVVGAVAGAVLGEQSEKALVGKKPGLEITVRLEASKELLVINQAKTTETTFKVGDRVRVLRSGNGTAQVQSAATP